MASDLSTPLNAPRPSSFLCAGEIPPGKLPYFEIPVFNYHKGHFFANFSSNYFFLSQRHPEVPR